MPFTYTVMTPVNLGNAPVQDTFSVSFASQRVWSAQGVFDQSTYSFIF